MMVKKESSENYDSLTLNLQKTNNDEGSTNEGNDGDINEEDLELLEYQRQRSTPKIEINQFEEDQDFNEHRDKEALKQKELFSQVNYLLDIGWLVLRVAPERQIRAPEAVYVG